jgi:hypothetical protein
MNESLGSINVSRLVSLLDRLGSSDKLEDLVDALVLRRWIQIHYPSACRTEPAPQPQRTTALSQINLTCGEKQTSLRPRLVPSKTVPEQASIQEDMLRMASEMKEVAGGVQSIIRRDVLALGHTTYLQDSNINQTTVQTSSADAIKRSKRIGFLFMIFMVLSSIAVFIALFFLIVVIT